MPKRVVIDSSVALKWWLDVNPYLSKTYKESAKYGHAIYDIVYMVIAESKHIPFITADNKFCDKVPRSLLIT